MTPMTQTAPPPRSSPNGTPTETRVLEFDPADVLPAAGHRPVTPEQVAASGLLGNVETNGQLAPGVLYDDPELPGKKRASDGNRRLMCCRILGIKFKAILLDHA